jgi:hypothetical protein
MTMKMKAFFFALLFEAVFGRCLYARSMEISLFFDKANRCDYLIFTPQVFSEGAFRLAQYRGDFEGDDVKAPRYVVFEKLLAQFSRPDLKPDTILRESISWAVKNWDLPPSSIVLLGDDSVKMVPGDSLPQSRGPMPTHITGPFINRDGDHYDTIFDYCDDWFIKTCVDSSDSGCSRPCTEPPLALGRIPCEQPSDINRYIEKVQRYEALRPDPWRNRVLFLHDDNFQNGNLACDNFSSCSDSNMQHLAGRFSDRLFFSDYSGNASAARKSFFSHVNSGAGWTVYYGHGSPWAFAYEQIVGAGDCALFRNADMPTILFSYGCSNGAFYRPVGGSMCKRFLFTNDGGAVAYIANPNIASGDFPALLNEIIRLRDSLPGLSIGKLLAYAKRNECLSSNYWEVLGDPALQEGGRVAPLSLRLHDNTTVECAVQSPLMSDAAIAWKLTQTREQYDSLCANHEWRDSIIAAGTAALAQGVRRITLPPLPQGGLLRLSVYAWNDSFESRGVVRLNETVRRRQSVNDMKRRETILCATVLPFRGVLFAVGLPQKSSAVIELFDPLGRLLHTMTVPPGTNRILWDSKGTSSGIYLAYLKVNGISRGSVLIHR